MFFCYACDIAQGFPTMISELGCSCERLVFKLHVLTNCLELFLCDCCNFFIIVFRFGLHPFSLLKSVIERFFYIKIVDAKEGERAVTIVTL